MMAEQKNSDGERRSRCDLCDGKTITGVTYQIDTTIISSPDEMVVFALSLCSECISQLIPGLPHKLSGIWSVATRGEGANGV